MRLFAAVALLPSGAAHDVSFDIAAGRFTAVEPGTQRGDAELLDGIALPGFANAHSHAFHRALRGRTHAGGGTFWTWRERMYDLAARVDPDAYHRLARAVYAEMALAGITTVGEFHYLHHDRDGRAYADPNTMGAALAAAAAEAGIRLTLLDACYLQAGVRGEPLAGVQRRFGDRDVHTWAGRVAQLADTDTVRHGVAAHSVRAVPAEALATVAAAGAGKPLHAHVSEQLGENEDCLAVHGCTPVSLLHEHGLLGANTTAVHAVHIDEHDIALLAESGARVCACPSTEHDLADGVLPAAALRDAGVPLSLGSDQHVLTDLFAEAQLLESDQRSMSLQRGRFSPDELLAAMTAHESLGWPDAGRLEVGARADLVVVRPNTVRTAGTDPAQLVLAASAADVGTVLVDGRVVVRDGQHLLGDVGALLGKAIGALW